MSVLICRPVSRRSNPEKIRRWISEMHDLRERHNSDPDSVQVIDSFLAQARSWVEE